MNNKLSFNLIIIIIGILLPSFVSANIPMKIKNITVFKNSAFILHEVDYNFPQGQNQIILENVSNNLIEESIQIALPEGVELLSYKYRNIDLTEEEIQNNAEGKFKELLEEKKLLLNFENELESVVLLKNMLKSSSNSSEVFKGLKAHEMEEWMQSYESKMMALIKKEQELKQKISDKKKEIHRIESQGYSSNNIRNKGEIHLTVKNTRAIQGKIHLQYGSNAASWKPQYELRMKDGQEKLNLLYKAVINQSTGIHWENVPVVLASAAPIKHTTVPVLNPWYIGFVGSEPVMYKSAMMARGASAEYRDDADITFEMMEKENVHIEEKSSYNEFQIQGTLSVRSHGDEQKVDLRSEILPVNMEYLAVPKVMQNIQRVGKVLLEDKGHYLPGSATIFYDNLMIGTTYLGNNQFKDTLELSFGEEARVVTQRKKVKDYSSNKIIGSKKTQEYQFEIKVENKKSSATSLIVKEQIPISKVKDLEVSLEDYGNAKWDKEKGILEWKLDLKANEIQTLGYTLKIKYPKEERIPIIN